MCLVVTFNMKKYKIAVGGNSTEIKRVLSILFKHGYVFSSNRVKTVEDIEKLWVTNE